MDNSHPHGVGGRLHHDFRPAHHHPRAQHHDRHPQGSGCPQQPHPPHLPLVCRLRHWQGHAHRQRRCAGAHPHTEVHRHNSPRPRHLLRARGSRGARHPAHPHSQRRHAPYLRARAHSAQLFHPYHPSRQGDADKRIIQVILCRLFCFGDASQGLNSADAAEGVGTALGMAMVLPYLVVATIGTILHLIGGFITKRGLFLAGLILECVSIFLMPFWGFGYIVVIIFGFIGHSKMKPVVAA